MKINDILKNKIKKNRTICWIKKYFVNTGWLFFERIIGKVIKEFDIVKVTKRYMGLYKDVLKN